MAPKIDDREREIAGGDRKEAEAEERIKRLATFDRGGGRSHEQGSVPSGGDGPPECGGTTGERRAARGIDELRQEGEEEERDLRPWVMPRVTM